MYKIATLSALLSVIAIIAAGGPEICTDSGGCIKSLRIDALKLVSKPLNILRHDFNSHARSISKIRLAFEAICTVNLTFTSSNKTFSQRLKDMASTLSIPAQWSAAAKAEAPIAAQKALELISQPVKLANFNQ
ncbi:hypothetical protein E3P77_04146 [Wallemia ichthyophaga]|nr:hypothetical protein E3P77_04146 [Wallemia ichthyophaga]